MTTTTVDQSLLDMEALEHSPELIKELREALRRGRPVTVSHTKVVVEPLERLNEQGYPVWGAPVSWHLCQEIVGETDDPVEGKLVELGKPEYVKGPLCV